MGLGLFKAWAYFRIDWLHVDVGNSSPRIDFRKPVEPLLPLLLAHDFLGIRSLGLDGTTVFHGFGFSGIPWSACSVLLALIELPHDLHVVSFGCLYVRVIPLVL